MAIHNLRNLVVLVGAGPGDEGLATRAAVEWIARADVIIYDRLANPALLGHRRAEAEMIYVGKTPGLASAEQEYINDLVVQHGRTGKLVVRLKGGDPFIFGRGGEEADALAEAGIPFRVVPGITAALAAGAYAGIPLTDRRHASSVAFVTGYQDPAKAATTINWQALAGIDTVVFYMGISTLPEIVAKLLAAGRAGETPCAIVQEASTPRQHVVTGPLKDLVAVAEKGKIKAPALTIVGAVTGIHPRLAWFEKLPLFGRTILLTRPQRQMDALGEPLALLGADVIEAPAIDIAPPTDDSLERALDKLAGYDLIVFTSANGADSFLAACRERGLDGRALAGCKLAAVGPATADALKAAFLTPDIVPAGGFTTAALADAIVATRDWTGKRVLLARADIATPALPEALAAAGAVVEEAIAYRTTCPEALPDAALAALRENTVDWITFTSSSTVANFLTMLDRAGIHKATLTRARLAAIGPVTAQTLAQTWRPCDIQPPDATAESLAAAMIDAQER